MELTTTETVAAGAVVVVVPLVVVSEVGTVPRLHTTMPLTALVAQVPGLAVAETKLELGSNWSFNRTPATGSPGVVDGILKGHLIADTHRAWADSGIGAWTTRPRAGEGKAGSVRPEFGDEGVAGAAGASLQRRGQGEIPRGCFPSHVIVQCGINGDAGADVSSRSAEAIRGAGVGGAADGVRENPGNECIAAAAGTERTAGSWETRSAVGEASDASVARWWYRWRWKGRRQRRSRPNR